MAGNQPSDLSSPIPNQEEDILSSLGIGGASAPAAAAAPAAPDVQAPQPEAAPPQEEAPQQAAPPSIDDQILSDLEEAEIQMGLVERPVPPSPASTGQRAKLSLLRTFNERKTFLESAIPGSEVTKTGSGQLLIKPPGSKDFIPVDPNGLLSVEEALKDTFGDGARLLLEVGTEVGMTVATGGTGKGLNAVAKAAGFSGASNLVSEITARTLGLPLDENRDIITETGEAAAIGGLMGAGGEMMFNAKNIFKATKDHYRKMRGKPIEAQAEGIILRPFGETLDENAKAAIRAADELENAGLGVRVKLKDGKEATFLVHNLKVGDPEVDSFLQKLQSDPEFLEIQRLQGEQVIKATNDILQSIDGRISKFGESASDQLGKSQKEIPDLLKAARIREGQIIGEAKKKISKEFRNQPMPAEELTRVRNQMLDDLNIRPGRSNGAFKDQLVVVTEAGKEVPLSAESLSNALGIPEGLKKSTGAKLFNQLNKLNELLENTGGISPVQIERFVGNFRNIFEDVAGNANVGRNLRKSTKDLIMAARRDRRRIIGDALEDETAKENFNIAMDQFSEIQTATGQLSDLLSSEGITPSAFMNELLRRGNKARKVKGASELADPAKTVRGIKAIMVRESPEAWNNLQAEFWDKMVRETTKENSIPFSMRAFRETLGRYDSSLINEMMEGSKFTFKDFKNIQILGERIERTTLGGKVAARTGQVEDQLAKSMAGFTPAKINLMVAMYNRLFSSLSVDDFLSKGGIEKIMKHVHGDKSVMRAKLELTFQIMRFGGVGTRAAARSAAQEGGGSRTSAGERLRRQLGEGVR